MNTQPMPSSGAERFVIALDRAHLRIYRAKPVVNGHLQLELSTHLPAGEETYTAQESDQAGRFGNPPGGPKGGSIDERLPMQQEHKRRLAHELAEKIESFLHEHPEATWDFAAGPSLHGEVLDQLSPAVRQRLGVEIRKNLVHQPMAAWPEELRLGRV